MKRKREDDGDDQASSVSKKSKSESLKLEIVQKGTVNVEQGKTETIKSEGNLLSFEDEVKNYLSLTYLDIQKLKEKYSKSIAALEEAAAQKMAANENGPKVSVKFLIQTGPTWACLH